MSIKLFVGDCQTVLREWAADSVDACVTDPPYGLSFMGKAWDYDVPSADIWREVYRVLKPGAHLLAFFGSRTYHRGVVQIEDAGFEIRDQIFWVYASGFPKSHNLDNLRGKQFCGCEKTEPSPEREMRSVLDSNVSTSVDTGQGRRQVLQPSVSQQSTPAPGRKQSASSYGSEQSGMEGRRDVSEAERQLCVGEICPMPAASDFDGAQRRIRHGASSGDGGMDRAATSQDGSGAPSRSQPTAQPPHQSGTMAVQPQSQDGGAWSNCGKCGKPVVPRGLGTALKPAHEPIVVARKPLIGTVAENVQRHGTGAINIDASRIHADDAKGYAYTVKRTAPGATQNATGQTKFNDGTTYEGQTKDGRWPANVIHDGSDEVVALFPDSKGQQGDVKGDEPSAVTKDIYGKFQGRVAAPARNDSGSAARFFKTCKMENEDWHHQERLDHLARSAESPSASCETNTAAQAAEIKNSDFRSEASLAIPASTGNCDDSTPPPSRVSNAATPENTGTTQITPIYTELNGCVPPATAENTNQADKEKVEVVNVQVQGTRFRYVPKADKADRDEGLDAFPQKPVVTFQTENGTSGRASSISEGRETAYRNTHPTVKPTALMRYLIKLVTPPGGMVLDPFMGSGSTGKAAHAEGFSFAGIERDPQWINIAWRRIYHDSPLFAELAQKPEPTHADSPDNPALRTPHRHHDDADSPVPEEASHGTLL